jgi:LEA14-like dessication related protein
MNVKLTARFNFEASRKIYFFDSMKTIQSLSIIFLLAALVLSCAPKDPVEFRGVKNIKVDAGDKDGPRLDADVYFYNPNKVKSKLKEISVDILVDGKKSGHVRQELKLPIPAQSEFFVPVEAQLSFKEIGLLDTVIGLFGGKKYEVIFTGYLKIVVHGVTVKVPVQQRQELKLNL